MSASEGRKGGLRKTGAELFRFFGLVCVFLNQFVDNRAVIEKVAEALVVMDSCDYICEQTGYIC